MDTTPIVEKLKRISELDAQIVEAARGLLEAIEVLQATVAIRTDSLREERDLLARQVEGECLNAGASIRGAGLQVIYSKGRETWDAKGLVTFAEANPTIDLYRFRKIGSPSARIVPLKKAE